MITGINHITLAVQNIDKSFVFYRDIVGLKPLVKWNKGAYLLAGDFWFCLTVDDKQKPSLCYKHYAFTISRKQFKRQMVLFWNLCAERVDFCYHENRILSG